MSLREACEIQTTDDHRVALILPNWLTRLLGTACNVSLDRVTLEELCEEALEKAATEQLDLRNQKAGKANA